MNLTTNFVQSSNGELSCDQSHWLVLGRIELAAEKMAETIDIIINILLFKLGFFIRNGGERVLLYIVHTGLSKSTFRL